MPRLPLFVAAPLVVALALTGCADPRDGGDWEPIRVPVVTVDVVGQFAEGQAYVVAEDVERPLVASPATWEAGNALAADESRMVIRAHAESAFEFELDGVAPGAVLRATTFVVTPFRKDPERADPAPVTFRVLVDGTERAAVRSDYILDAAPDAHPYDQLMRTLEVPLDAVPGESLTLRFETTRFGEPVPEGAVLAEPVWWDLVVEQPLDVPRQVADARAPNVLVMCIDTLAARRMSLHEYGRDTTPTLREWARGGAVFEEVDSPSSWTLPSTASLLTGLPPNAHSVLGDLRSYLIEGLVTWPEALRAAGIPGAGFVANPLVAEANNFDQGFDHWHHEIDADATDLNDEFLAWLDEQPAGARWFAYVHYMEPHAPYAAPEPYKQRFVPDDAGSARDFDRFHPAQAEADDFDPLTDADRARIADLYDGEVYAFDAAFAALLDALEARGLRDTTTIVLTADHGEELFEHGRIGHGYDLTDVMLHVPLVIVGPGVPAGARRDEPVAGASVHNTVLELAGVAPHEDAAPSLLGLLEGRGGDEAPVFALARTHLFGPRRTLVSARDVDGRKVICALGEDLVASADDLEALRDGSTLRAHDLTRDRGESSPLDLTALDRAEADRYRALRDAALQWFLDTRAMRPEERQPEVAGMREMLEQVGYIDGEDDEGADR